MTTPWQIGNVPGPKQAALIKRPELVEKFTRSGRCLLVVGRRALGVKIDGRGLIEALSELADVDIVATGQALRAFAESGKRVPHANALDIVNRVLDRGWQGVSGGGPYDVVMLLGMDYMLESQLLAALKHFAPGVKTLSLDPFYQPNADFSFPNLEWDEWRGLLKAIIDGLSNKSR